MFLDSSLVLSLLKFKSISTEFLVVKIPKLKTTKYENENGSRSLGIFLIKEKK